MEAGRCAWRTSSVPLSLRVVHAGRHRCRRLLRARTRANANPNPDFDETKLDAQYYRELGIDEDELDAQTTFAPGDIDPEGAEMDLDSLFQPRDGAPQDMLDALSEHDAYGPKALLLAGMRLEELAVTRELLDAAGASDVKVVPVQGDMLQAPMDAALATPEPAWELPRPQDWSAGGSWGSQRVGLFSGLSLRAAATAVELLEESGLPPMCVALAMAEDGQRPLGQVLAEAVQDQRGRKNPDKQLWEDSPHLMGSQPQDLSDLPDVQELIKAGTSQRLEELERAAEEGRLEEVLLQGASDMTPEEIARLPNMSSPFSDSAESQPATAAAEASANTAAVADAVAADRPAAAAAAGASPQHNSLSSHDAASTGTAHTSAALRSSGETAAAVVQQPAAQQMHKAGTQAAAPATSIASPAAAAGAGPAPKPKTRIPRRMYQQPAGPAPPSAANRQRFASGGDPGSDAAAAAAEQQPASGSDRDLFYAKLALENLRLQREAAQAAAPLEQPGWVPPMDWQSELQQVKQTGQTRADLLAGREPIAQRMPTQSPSEFDLIDIIANMAGSPEPLQSQAETAATGLGLGAGEPPVHTPLSREPFEAAIQSSTDFERAGNEGAVSAERTAASEVPVRTEEQSQQQVPPHDAGRPLTPWGTPTRSKGRSPFQAANTPYSRLSRRQAAAETRKPSVQPMTLEEMRRVAARMNKDPDAMVVDAQQNHGVSFDK